MSGLTNSNYTKHTHTHKQQQSLQAIHLNLETSKPMFNKYYSNDRTKVECYNCHKKGHFRSNYPKKEGNKKEKKSNFNKKFVDVVITSDNFEFVGMSVASESVKIEKKNTKREGSIVLLKTFVHFSHISLIGNTHTVVL